MKALLFPILIIVAIIYFTNDPEAERTEVLGPPEEPHCSHHDCRRWRAGFDPQEYMEFIKTAEPHWHNDFHGGYLHRWRKEE